MSERLVAEASEDEGKAEAIRLLGGLDPEIAEAAALAHDLGNPPFGHAGEDQLDRLITAKGVSDGFEGNAQGFRILTRLAARGTEPVERPGLGLTRALLRATLKYPWPRARTAGDNSPDGERGRKWGAYDDDVNALEFALALDVEAGGRSPKYEARSLEAEVMDWADDVTYAVHDAEDFYRAGLIPLDQISGDDDVCEAFIERAAGETKTELARAQELFNVVRLWLPTERYDGTRKNTAAIGQASSLMIDRFTRALILNPPDAAAPLVSIDDDIRTTVDLLKRLVWHYVIQRPGLATQQKGQHAVIAELFKVYTEAAASEPRLLPAHASDPKYLDKTRHERVAADVIANLTEQEAVILHRRLTGVDPGSILDPML
jgi:dGTPase